MKQHGEREKLDLEAVVRKVAGDSRGSSGVTVPLHVYPKLKQGEESPNH